jgi:hypothetical protein
MQPWFDAQLYQKSSMVSNFCLIHT